MTVPLPYYDTIQVAVVTEPTDPQVVTIVESPCNCGGDGSGDATYTNLVPTPIQVGGIPVGTTFDHQTLKQVLDELLYPYQAPAVQSFQGGISTVNDVGQPVPASLHFTWAFTNLQDLVDGSVKILDGSTVLADGLSGSGSADVAVSVPTPQTPTSHTWTIQGTDTKGNVHSGAWTVTWLWRDYAGTGTNSVLTGVQISNLAVSVLASSAAGTYAHATGGYKFWAFPASFPAPTGFNDTATRLSITMADAGDDPAFNQSASGFSFATVTVNNPLGVPTTYRLYRSRYVLGGALSAQVS